MSQTIASMVDLTVLSREQFNEHLLQVARVERERWGDELTARALEEAARRLEGEDESS